MSLTAGCMVMLGVASRDRVAGDLRTVTCGTRIDTLPTATKAAMLLLQQARTAQQQRDIGGLRCR